ncbi:MAG TPA: cyclic nucleotide-binding domain-containing protein [Usitatibacter sp.]|nr:cyclic nucleotide-binding domain-containing protein [Usitatibacter sp.]
MPVKLEWFNNEADAKDFAKGVTVFAEGEKGTTMYVITRGAVELHVGGKLMETLGPGEPFGELALIDRAPRNATAITRTPCKLVPVELETFRSLVRLEPDFAVAIMKVMADRLRRMNVRTMEKNAP